MKHLFSSTAISRNSAFLFALLLCLAKTALAGGGFVPIRVDHVLINQVIPSTGSQIFAQDLQVATPNGERTIPMDEMLKTLPLYSEISHTDSEPPTECHRCHQHLEPHEWTLLANLQWVARGHQCSMVSIQVVSTPALATGNMDVAGKPDPGRNPFVEWSYELPSDANPTEALAPVSLDEELEDQMVVSEIPLEAMPLEPVYLGEEGSSSEKGHGQEQVAAPGLALWPNPSAGLLKVGLYNAVDGRVTYQILDGNGRILQHWQHEGQGPLELDLGRFAAGTYLLQATQGQIRLSEQVFLVK